MSEIYNLEPPTFGRVIFDTTCGPLDILLWSKECPKTCLNFVQLCLDGYYNGCTFHTIIKDFIVQTGDPTNTGYGGESIYNKDPFSLEVHPRLMYRYRGLVGLASITCETAITDNDDKMDPDTVTQNKHGSQFFITLAAASCLNRKNTLFGKVHGDSLYNLLNLADIPIDKNHHPLDPPYIKGVEVVLNPFPALQPRPNSKMALQSKNDVMCESKEQMSQNSKRKRRKVLNCRKKDSLSFEVDDDDKEEDDVKPLENLNNTEHCNSKESLNAASVDDSQKTSPSATVATNTKSEKLVKLKERIEFHEKNKLLKLEKEAYEEDDDSHQESNSEEIVESDSTGSEDCDELRVVKQARSVRHAVMDQLKTHILSFKKGQGTVEHVEAEKESVQDANLLTESEKRRQVYLCRRTQNSRKQKEEKVLKELERFQNKLREAKKKHQEDVDSGSESNSNWYCGKGLRFAVDSARAYEIDSSKDALTVFDPLAKMTEEAKIKLRNLQHERMMPSLKKKIFL